jgi:hypothetical protein
MLTVIAHLALILGRMAPHRQITTDLNCDCVILMHVRTEPSIRLLTGLGFKEVPRPAEEAEAETEVALDGTLLKARISAKGGMAQLMSEGDLAGAAFFGIVNDLARILRGNTQWPAPTAP